MEMEKNEPVPVAVDAVAITESDGGATHAGQPHSQAKASSSSHTYATSGASTKEQSWGWAIPGYDKHRVQGGEEEEGGGGGNNQEEEVRQAAKAQDSDSAFQEIVPGSVAERCALFETRNNNVCSSARREMGTVKRAKAKNTGEEIEGNEEEEEEEAEHPSLGQEVYTPYGTGVVEDVRVVDASDASGGELRIEVSSLSFGTLYSPKRSSLRPSTIKAAIEGAVESVVEGVDLRVDGTSVQEA